MTSSNRDSLLLNAALRRGLLTPEQAQAAQAEAQRARASLSAVIRGPLFLGEERARALEAELANAESELTTAIPPGPSPPPPPPPPPPAGTLPPPDATADLNPRGAHMTTSASPAASPGDEASFDPIPSRLGPFEVLEKLGQGGMGAVYKARDPNLGRIVALKVLAPALRADREAADRFLREARAAAAVNHPNVITVHAVAGPDDPFHYMALEYLPGGDAEALAERHGGRLPEPLALSILRDCARGLVAIERAGLVHRDLKPANIFVTEDGVAKLADLGLARSQAGDDRMTVTGTIVGTPAFMAPEQARAEQDLDIRTDIYSLGASLFGLLAGKPPFVGSSAFVVVSNLLNKPPPKLEVIREDLHPQTLALIRKMMAKEREDRFQDASSLLAAIEGLTANLQAGSGQTTFMAQAPQGPRPAHPGTPYPGQGTPYLGQGTPYPGQGTPYPGGPPPGHPMASHSMQAPGKMSTADVIQKVLMMVGAGAILLFCCCVGLAVLRNA